SLCGLGHCSVVTMLAGNIEECRDDDIGAELAIGPNQAVYRALFAPARQSVRARFRKPKVMHRIIGSVPKPSDISVNHAGGLFQLAAAHHAQSSNSLRPQRVLATLTACGAGNDNPRPMLMAQHCQHRTV